MIKCAILDDYQNVALCMANWSSITDRIAIRTYQEPFETEEMLVNALYHDEIIVLMRERTPFTAAIFKKLPNLKLLVTSGMRNASIDLEAASEQDIRAYLENSVVRQINAV